MPSVVASPVDQHRDELFVRRGRRHRTTGRLLDGLVLDRRLSHLASLLDQQIRR
ncbi:hypothetical protein OHA79_52520 (plasmid) [Streptomyces sp. NBC_00841]|uniref:hypothetical protein n=1 Tax=Streptomyces sp. NBC_00841 TaxID=2975847 RepID=UPI002DDA9ECD|nr:hypothetical protein [Streptomyces sp. NBC_00841]WSA06098.1 hypothetical protein OHA79_52520 [Streptomyces sp. NBC_00841]